jgi:ElaB/YqjD/DUF883 family membrane-anchored ribosome-binding protein
MIRRVQPWGKVAQAHRDARKEDRMNPRQLEQIEQDLKRLLGEVEAAAEQAVDNGSGAVRQARRRIADALDLARDRLDGARERARYAAHATDEYVHEQPWPAIGAALVVGLVAGLLIGRR